MQKIIKILITVPIFLMLIVPVVSFAAFDPLKGLVPCNGADCDFDAFMKLINGVIDFIFKFMAIPIAAIMFAYAGFLLVTAGGETASARTKAKNIFWNAAIGLVLAAGAWLIVKTILVIMGYKFVGDFFP